MGLSKYFVDFIKVRDGSEILNIFDLSFPMNIHIKEWQP